MYSDSGLRNLNDVKFEQYLDTDEGRADARVNTEILIRLFKARTVTVDDLLAQSDVPDMQAFEPVTGFRVW